ncbi:MAG: hypothetical protein ABI649_03460 [Gaiellaceae bacterium]
MGVVAIVLVACAVALLAGAEWPRLSARFGLDARRSRKRARRKGALTVIEGEAADPDDFAKSVERDLENLPVLGERDDRSRR